jgi:uncharacterized protein
MKAAGLLTVAVLSLTVLGVPPPWRAVALAQAAAPRTFSRHVLAWADVRNGYQHESITHALSTIERLGWDSGLYDTIIRTDSQSITKSPVLFRQGTGIASGEQFLARNLYYFDAIFFFGVREIDLDAQQRADLLRFVRDDGKGFVATHAGATAFFSWPEFGDMLGGRFDEHPWGISEATVIVENRTSPITRHLPATFTVTDEHYQLKEFSRDKVQVLARLDPATLDLKAPLVHRTDRDFAVAYTKTYGKGRVFYSTLGHPRELWDQSWLQTMYFEALKWSMRLP